MFPTATSRVYRNGDGEVLGWDSTYYDEPDYDPADEDYRTPEEWDEFYDDPDGCRDAGVHGDDAQQDRWGEWMCDRCGHEVLPEDRPSLFMD